MAKPSSPSTSSHHQQWLFLTQDFLGKLGISGNLIPADSHKKDQYSDLIRGLLKVDRIEHERVICRFVVKEAVVNPYNTLHGGVVSAVAESVGLACVRTVVAEDKELVLGELSMSYLSAAALNNCFGMLHGGAVAAVAELVSLACLRTVVAEDKEVFLGELSISYLSAAIQNMEVEVDGYIVRRGRNIIVTAIEFRVKKTRQLVYTARATFYNMPLANL